MHIHGLKKYLFFFLNFPLERRVSPIGGEVCVQLYHYYLRPQTETLTTQRRVTWKMCTYVCVLVRKCA